jgi:hypothetical protein
LSNDLQQFIPTETFTSSVRTQRHN